MTACPSCQQPASKRDGHDPAGRQRYACHACGRDFTDRSGSAFAGYRWPPEVILLAVRWSLSHPLSATSIMELLAERGIDVSKRTVLRWVQTFGPRLAAEVRQHRRPLGRKCYVDEVFFFRGAEKRYLYGYGYGAPAPSEAEGTRSAGTVADCRNGPATEARRSARLTCPRYPRAKRSARPLRSALLTRASPGDRRCESRERRRGRTFR